MENHRIHPLRVGLGHVFIIENKTDLVLIDAGSPGFHPILLRKIAALSPARLRLILLTHAHIDHSGCAAAVRRITGAPIAIHPGDAEELSLGETDLGQTRSYGFAFRVFLPLVERLTPPEPAKADILLSGNFDLSPFGITARVIHTPGHTPGSCSIILSDGDAFVSDLLGQDPLPHLQSLLATDWDLLPSSLDYLLQMHPQRVFSGHSSRPIPGADLVKLKRPA